MNACLEKRAVVGLSTETVLTCSRFQYPNMLKAFLVKFLSSNVSYMHISRP